MNKCDSTESLLYTRPQAAKACNLSVRTLDSLLAAEEIPVVRFGKRGVRIASEDLRAWIRTNKYRGRRKVVTGPF